MEDQVEYRPWQRAWIDSGIGKALRGEKLMVGNIGPGSGKTLGALALANELFRRDLIDAVIVLVPRLNLCAQFELDWRSERPKFAGRVMGMVVHRKNEPPLFKEGIDGHNFGYVTTYDSVVWNLEIHLHALKGKRFMLVLDEAQRLGCTVNGDDGTQAGKIALTLAGRAAFVVLLSGTPYRGDGQPLILAEYSEPDANGKRHLIADITVDYLEGVKEGYLRPFEAILCDGKGLKEYLGGNIEHLVLSEMEKGMAAILQDRSFWQPVVDKTITKIREVQQIHPDFCGLIGASRQEHAKAIIKYVESQGLRALLAVSDERLAQDNLRQFKEGGYDVLVTVAMAHVGYDHKPITVVTCLNHFRESSWLEQFIARGARMWKAVPRDHQILHFICPNDIPMCSFVDWMRTQSERGLAERKQKDDRDREYAEPALCITRDVALTSISAKGMDPDNDLDPEDFSEVDGLRIAYKLGPAPNTQLARLLRDKGVMPTRKAKTQAPQPTLSGVALLEKDSAVTEREWEGAISAKIDKLCKRADAILRTRLGESWRWGNSATRICTHFRIPGWTGLGTVEMQKVLTYVTEVYMPAVRRGEIS